MLQYFYCVTVVKQPFLFMINWPHAQELHDSTLSTVKFYYNNFNNRKFCIYCIYGRTSIDRHRWDLDSDG